MLHRGDRKGRPFLGQRTRPGPTLRAVACWTGRHTPSALFTRSRQVSRTAAFGACDRLEPSGSDAGPWTLGLISVPALRLSSALPNVCGGPCVNPEGRGCDEVYSSFLETTRPDVTEGVPKRRLAPRRPRGQHERHRRGEQRRRASGSRVRRVSRLRARFSARGEGGLRWLRRGGAPSYRGRGGTARRRGRERDR